MSRKDDLDAHRELVRMIREKAKPEEGQRVSHPFLMAAAELLSKAAEKERVGGNIYRASEINHLIIAVFKAAIRIEDIVPDAPEVAA